MVLEGLSVKAFFNIFLFIYACMCVHMYILKKRKKKKVKILGFPIKSTQKVNPLTLK